MNGQHEVRVATADDAGVIGQLLHDFNTEYNDITPGPARLADRRRAKLYESLGFIKRESVRRADNLFLPARTMSGRRKLNWTA